MNLQVIRKIQQAFYHSIILYLTSYLTLFYIANWNFIVEYNSLRQMSYWVLSKTLPLLLFSIVEVKTFNFRFAKSYFIFAVIAIGTLLLLRVHNQIGFREIFGFKQNYIPVIEYVSFSVIYFHLFNIKFRNHLKSFAYALMFLSIAGLIYEIPVFTRETIVYSSHYPFIINPRWLMLFLIGWKTGLKPFLQPLTLLALTVLLLYSLWYYLDPTQPTWLPRLPTLLFFTVLITKMKGARQLACD